MRPACKKEVFPEPDSPHKTAKRWALPVTKEKQASKMSFLCKREKTSLSGNKKGCRPLTGERLFSGTVSSSTFK